MIYDYDFFYNGISAKSLGIYAIERPNIPAPERNKTFYEIKGRDGSVSVDDGTYKDIEIEIQLNYMSKNPDKWAERYRKIKRWLIKNNTGRLQFSDDLSYYRKVKNVSIAENERTSIRIGVLTPKFRCDPFEYPVIGDKPLESYQKIYNPYDLSKPVYKIKGEGVCTLTVNSKTMKANVSNNLTIDTELMIAYREDDGNLYNTAVTGYFNNLYLVEEENTISITSGFNLEVIPRWRVL